MIKKTMSIIGVMSLVLILSFSAYAGSQSLDVYSGKDYQIFRSGMQTVDYTLLAFGSDAYAKILSIDKVEGHYHGMNVKRGTINPQAGYPHVMIAYAEDHSASHAHARVKW